MSLDMLSLFIYIVVYNDVINDYIISIDGIKHVVVFSDVRVTPLKVTFPRQLIHNGSIFSSFVDLLRNL